MQDTDQSTFRSRRAALGNVARLWLALVATGLLAIAARFLLGRTYGAAGLGVFATALTVTTLVARFGVFGVNNMLLDVHGTEGRAASRWNAASGKVVVAMTGLAVLAGSGWAANRLPPLSRDVVFLLMPLVFVAVVTNLLAAQYQVSSRFRELAVVRTLHGFSRIVPVLIGVAAGFAVIGTARVFFVTGCVIGVVALVALVRVTRSNTLPGADAAPDPRPGVLAVFRRTWAYAVSGMMFLLYFQIDILIVREIEGEQQTGLYAAAVAIVTFVYLFPNAVYRQYLAPKFHVWAAGDLGRLRSVHRHGTRIMLAIGLGAGAFTALAGPLVLDLGFGGEFSDATTALVILAAAIPIRFAGASVSLVMATRPNIATRAGIQVVAAALNVALNLALIPRYGIEGAAIATVISELALLVLQWIPGRRFLAATPETDADLDVAPL